MAYEAAGDSTVSDRCSSALVPAAGHELGALAFATAARRAGLPILYLGPDLPPESWTSAAERRDAVAAVVGVPTRADVQRARAVIDALRAARHGLLTAVGGDEAGRLAGAEGVTHLTGDLAHSVGTLRSAIGNARPG